MKQAKPSDIQKLRDALKEEVLMWLGLFGKEPVTLEKYKDTPHDNNFCYLQAWGFLDEVRDFRDFTDMALRLNDKAIAFLNDPTTIQQLKNISKV